MGQFPTKKNPLSFLGAPIYMPKSAQLPKKNVFSEFQSTNSRCSRLSREHVKAKEYQRRLCQVGRTTVEAVDPNTTGSWTLCRVGSATEFWTLIKWIILRPNSPRLPFCGPSFKDLNMVGNLTGNLIPVVVSYERSYLPLAAAPADRLMERLCREAERG